MAITSRLPLCWQSSPRRDRAPSNKLASLVIPIFGLRYRDSTARAYLWEGVRGPTDAEEAIAVRGTKSIGKKLTVSLFF